MNANKKYSLCIGSGVVVEIAALLAILVLGIYLGGLLYPTPASYQKIIPPIITCVFPYSCYDEHVAAPLGAAIILVSLLQWPLYGWILGSGWVHQRFLKYFTILISIHAIAVFLALWFTSKYPPIDYGPPQWHV